jgi:Protein of unknown function (DUF3102)
MTNAKDIRAAALAKAMPELSQHAKVIRALGKRAFDDIVEIGRRLIECERLCKAEGNWLQWIKDEFGWSRQTADNFIEIAKASDRVPNFGSLNVPISALYLLAQPNTPSEVIEEVAERSKRGERLKLAQVKELAKRVPTGRLREGEKAHKIVAPVEPSTPPQREVSLVSPGVTIPSKPSDSWLGVMLSVLTQIERYYKSASGAQEAELASLATAFDRDRETIRHFAETIIAALDDAAGPVTLEEVERRRRQMN